MTAEMADLSSDPSVHVRGRLGYLTAPSFLVYGLADYEMPTASFKAKNGFLSLGAGAETFVYQEQVTGFVEVAKQVASFGDLDKVSDDMQFPAGVRYPRVSVAEEC